MTTAEALRTLGTAPFTSSERTREAIAERGKADLFYLASVILGYRDLTKHTHGPLCRFFDTCGLKRRMMFLPRTHYKSSTITIAGSIKDIINDPNVTILIVASTGDNAERFNVEIQRHFMNNQLFQWLYPEVIWDDFNKAPRWNKHETEVPRTTHVREPTVDTLGSRGEVVSRHYKIIRLDDIIGESEFQSETEMRRTCEWLSGVQYLLVPPWEDHLIDIVGTRWKLDDVYAFAEFIYGGRGPTAPLGPHAYKVGRNLAIFSRGARENGVPIFPEKFPSRVLDELQLSDPERYAAQMANDPLSKSATEFQTEWLKYYTFDEKGRVLLEDDPAPLDIQKCPTFILCDPSLGEGKKSDRTAIHVVCADLRTKFRLVMLEAFIKRIPPNEIIDKLFEFSGKYPWARTLSIESVAFQKALKYWVEEREVTTRKTLPTIYEYTAGGNKSKIQRVKGLIPLFRAKQVYIQSGFTEFIEEYTAWHPQARVDDGLDALAQILEFVDFGWSKETSSQIDEFNKLMSECRSNLTGY